MTAAKQTKRAVAHIDFAAARLPELVVGEEDAQRAPSHD
jgi:hypothetical protein